MESEPRSHKSQENGYALENSIVKYGHYHQQNSKVVHFYEESHMLLSLPELLLGSGAIEWTPLSPSQGPG